MLKSTEETIGTFLYAASSRSHLVYHLVFTSTRILAVSLSWKKNNIIIDTVMALIQNPFQGGIRTESILMENWKDIKNKNENKSLISYQKVDVLGIGLAGSIFHEIHTIPYSILKKITIEENPSTNDYKVEFDAGPLASATFLIPGYSLLEFNGLIEMTPAAKKLVTL